MGKGKSHYSTCDYKKNLSGHVGKSFSGHTKGQFAYFKKVASLKKSVYSDFRVVAELTDSGFLVKGSDNKMLTIITNEDTVVYKGEEKNRRSNR